MMEAKAQGACAVLNAVCSFLGANILVNAKVEQVDLRCGGGFDTGAVSYTHLDVYKRQVKIKDCTAVPKSKKLLQFTLDDGSGADRTILSGIHEYYEPEELIGKTAIAIVNLPPRKMMGIDSCGMLISAVHEEDGKEGLNLLICLLYTSRCV